ncbi:hypothetical protein F5146DRAFT_1140679 [Armillaria mellea]|nr:hypothetical protein F5146DRAFT_1140679 [Armillaria mellea]
MSSSTHELKRSLQDLPVNLTKMQMVRTHPQALEEELRVEETEEEVQQIMSYADTLDAILERKRLAVNQDELSKQLGSPAVDATCLNDLQTQLKRIYRHVSMRMSNPVPYVDVMNLTVERLQHKPGVRMALEAFLLTVAEASVNGGAKLPVTIFPEMSKAVRYCLSDGQTGIFSLYVKDEQGYRISYEGDPFAIMEPHPDAEDASKKDVQTVAELLYHGVVSDVDLLNDLLYTMNDF